MSETDVEVVLQQISDREDRYWTNVQNGKLRRICAELEELRSIAHYCPDCGQSCKGCQCYEERLRSTTQRAEAAERERDAMREAAIDGAILEAAHDNIGIYPQSVSGGQKPYEKRTDWMEGWNACTSKLSDYQCRIAEWLRTSPAREAVEALILQDEITLHVGDDGITPLVNCNDLFHWGCADAEEIELDELPQLQQACIESPTCGRDLWVCRNRGMRPQGAVYKGIPPAEWPLFDACGPPRAVEFGNPVEHPAAALSPPAEAAAAGEG